MAAVATAPWEPALVGPGSRCNMLQERVQGLYSARGRGFIECHHSKPVHTLVEGTRTKLEDLALLCANCHRMVHATRPWLSISELRAMIESHRPDQKATSLSTPKQNSPEWAE